MIRYSKLAEQNPSFNRIYLLGLDENIWKEHFGRDTCDSWTLQILYLRVPRDGRKVEDDILSHGRFPSKYQRGRKIREEGGKKQGRGRRREMALVVLLSVAPLMHQGRERAFYINVSLDPARRIFHRRFPSTRRGNRLRKARERMTNQRNTG